jgi:predicted permease
VTVGRLFGRFRRRQRDTDLTDELNGHLEAHIEDNLRADMSSGAARRDALLKLGGVVQATEAYRAQQRLPFVETTMQDLRYALRMLRKTPGFAAAAILTLALGIGANTAIFSVLNAVILKPLEYQQPDRLMRIASSFPGRDDFWVSIPEFLVGTATAALWVLQGAVVLVLLIACANLSTLLLSRAESRRKEFAVRAAIGATLSRLLRQAIAEGCLLSVAGATLGLGVAVAGIRALVAAFPDSLPRSGGISLDWRVLTFTFVVALATGVIFGIAPLLHLGPGSTTSSLKEGGQRATAGRHALRRGLVVCEVALAVALVAGAGLLIRTVSNLTRVDAGFNRSRLVTFAVSLPTARYATPADRQMFYQRLLDDLRAAPGVLKVAAMVGLPPLRLVNANSTMIEGIGATPGNNPEVDYYQQVTFDYLDTMGIPVLEGQGFRDADPTDAPTVLVNQTMARTFWPGQSPVGHRLRPCCNPATPWFTVAGVVRDVKQGGVDQQAGTELYFNASRNTPPTMNVVIRTPLPPESLAGAIQRAVGTLDPSLPIVRLRAMDEVFEESIGRPRLLAQLLALFAALALLLSTIGTYGVLSYMVTERRREIGVRMALGATRQSVMGMVVGQGLRLTLAGVVIGVGLALAGGRLISSLLFGVGAGDPATIAGVVALIGAVAIAACSLPGLSATRVDPMVALRKE